MLDEESAENQKETTEKQKEIMKNKENKESKEEENGIKKQRESEEASSKYAAMQYNYAKIVQEELALDENGAEVDPDQDCYDQFEQVGEIKYL